VKRVLLARNAGFCSGVQRAVSLALKAAKQSRKIYTLGEIIHNRQVVEMLKKRGIVPINEISELKAGDTVLVRSHGVERGVREELKRRNINIIDSTCPKVQRIHSILKRYMARGARIVIFGDKGHPEVKALCSEAPDSILISSVEDIEKVPCDRKPICLVAQTTQNKKQFDEIARILTERCGNVEKFDTICQSTSERQSELQELLKEADAVVVVGGTNSANTRRLAEISESSGKPTYRIETASDLDIERLKNHNTIAVTAGASTPNWVIKDVLRRIRSAVGERLSFWRLILMFFVYSNILASLSAAALTTISLLLLDIPLNLAFIFASALYVFAVHTANQLLAIREEPFGEKSSVVSYLRGILAGASAIASVLLLYQYGFATTAFLILAIVAGLLYGVDILPARLVLRSLKDIPGSKEIFCAIGWASVASILPILAQEVYLAITKIIAAFALAFFPVYLRSLLLDVRQIEKDRLMGREATILALGSQATRRIVTLLIGGWIALLLACELFGIFGRNVLLILVMPLGFVLTLLLQSSRFLQRELAIESLLDITIIASSTLILLW